MKTTVMNPVKAFTLIALGLAIAAMGIHATNADDARPVRGTGAMIAQVSGRWSPPRDDGGCIRTCVRLPPHWTISASDPQLALRGLRFLSTSASVIIIIIGSIGHS